MLKQIWSQTQLEDKVKTAYTTNTAKPQSKVFVILLMVLDQQEEPPIKPNFWFQLFNKTTFLFTSKSNLFHQAHTVT